MSSREDGYEDEYNYWQIVSAPRSSVYESEWPYRLQAEQGWPCDCGVTYDRHTQKHRLTVCDAYYPMENLAYIDWKAKQNLEKNK